MMNLESFAIHKKPGGGVCSKSSFADGQHRAGLVPTYSVLDGGASGDHCDWFCMDCEKPLKRFDSMFVIIKQPSSLRKGG